MKRSENGHNPVFLVADDPRTRAAVGGTIKSAGLTVEVFDTADRFFEQSAPRLKGCVVLDVRAPCMQVLDILDRIQVHCPEVRCIVLGRDGFVSSLVRAVKTGMVDLLDKPCEVDALLQRVQQALSTNGVSGGAAFRT
jgi:two-component system response regulator FixJ